jgi:hypothetical protein
MRVRLRVAVTICASVVALAVAPTIANACPSLANVNSYQGHTATFFDAQGSGSDVGNGGTYAAQWERNVAHASVDLTHKQVLRNRITGTRVIFSGKASGGTVTIDDGSSRRSSHIQTSASPCEDGSALNSSPMSTAFPQTHSSNRRSDRDRIQASP